LYAAPKGQERLFTRRFWIACSVHFCGAMGPSLYILFPLFIRHLGGSDVIIGLYAGLTGAAAVAARLPLGRWLDTQGRRRMMTAAGCLHVAAWLGFLSVEQLGMLSALLVVALGVAGGALFACFFTYANDITPITRRSEGIGMFAIWGMMPNGLGPLLGEFLINRGSFQIYFLVAAAFALLSLCLTQLLPETVVRARTRSTDAAPPQAGLPYRGLLLLLVLTFTFGAAINGVYTFFAPFMQARGGGSIGSFFVSYSFMAVAVRVLTGRLPDRLGLRRVLIPALFLFAAGVLLIPWARDTASIIAVGLMCGAGHGYAFPILNALITEQVLPTQRGRAISWLTAMFDLGNTLANPFFGAIAETAGYNAMFTAAGAGVFTATAIAWRKWSRHEALAK
jgi:MFS family permease